MAALVFSLSFEGVNHGKQTSLFRNAAWVKKERGFKSNARAKSVFMLEIMAGRVTAFGNIVAVHHRGGSQISRLCFSMYFR